MNPDLSDEQRESMGARSAALLASDYSELLWEHSHGVVHPDGRQGTFCIYTAPDRETICAHAESLGGHEVVRILEISGDYSPADFPL